MDRALFVPIVCIPEHGPLEARLLALGIEVHVIEPLKIGRQTLGSPWQLLRLPWRQPRYWTLRH